MIASFIVGFIAGIIALLAFAVQYVDRKETEATPHDNRIAAVGLPNMHTHRQAKSIFHLPKGTA